jgi:hypothetical protein
MARWLSRSKRQAIARTCAADRADLTRAGRTVAVVRSMRPHNPGKAEDAMREHLRMFRTQLFGQH